MASFLANSRKSAVLRRRTLLRVHRTSNSRPVTPHSIIDTEIAKRAVLSMEIRQAAIMIRVANEICYCKNYPELIRKVSLTHLNFFIWVTHATNCHSGPVPLGAGRLQPDRLLYLSGGADRVLLFLSAWLGEKNPGVEKSRAYESGIIPTGTARLRYPVPFYLVAIFF